MTTTNVQKARTTVGDLAAEHALRAQSKMLQLKVSPDIAPGSAFLHMLRAVVTCSSRRFMGFTSMLA